MSLAIDSDGGYAQHPQTGSKRFQQVINKRIPLHQVVDKQFLERLKLYTNLEKENTQLMKQNRTLQKQHIFHIGQLNSQNKMLRVRIIHYQQHIEKLFEVCRQVLQTFQKGDISHRNSPLYMGPISRQKSQVGLIRQNSLKNYYFNKSSAITQSPSNLRNGQNQNRQRSPFGQNSSSSKNFVSKGVARLQHLLSVQYAHYMGQNERQNKSVSSLQKKYDSEIEYLNCQIQSLLKSNSALSQSLKLLKQQYHLYTLNRIKGQPFISATRQSVQISSLRNQILGLKQLLKIKQSDQKRLKDQNRELREQIASLQKSNRIKEAHNSQILNKDLQKVKAIQKLSNRIKILEQNEKTQKQLLKNSKQFENQESQFNSSKLLDEEHQKNSKKHRFMEDQFHQMKKLNQQLQTVIWKNNTRHKQQLLQLNQQRQDDYDRHKKELKLLEQKHQSQEHKSSLIQLEYSNLTKEQSELQERVQKLTEQCENLEIQLSIKNSELNSYSEGLPWNSNPSSQQVLTSTNQNDQSQCIVAIQSRVDIPEEQLFKRIKSYHVIKTDNESAALLPSDLHYNCRLNQNKLKKDLNDFQQYVNHLQQQIEKLAQNRQIQAESHESLRNRYQKQTSIAHHLEEMQKQGKQGRSQSGLLSDDSIYTALDKKTTTQSITHNNSKDEDPAQSPIVILNDGEFYWQRNNLFLKNKPQWSQYQSFNSNPNFMAEKNVTAQNRKISNNAANQGSFDINRSIFPQNYQHNGYNSQIQIKPFLGRNQGHPIQSTTTFKCEPSQFSQQHQLQLQAQPQISSDFALENRKGFFISNEFPNIQAQLCSNLQYSENTRIASGSDTVTSKGQGIELDKNSGSGIKLPLQPPKSEASKELMPENRENSSDFNKNNEKIQQSQNYQIKLDKEEKTKNKQSIQFLSEKNDELSLEALGIKRLSFENPNHLLFKKYKSQAKQAECQQQQPVETHQPIHSRDQNRTRSFLFSGLKKKIMKVDSVQVL